MCASFPFGVEVGMWDLIGLVPDHCLSLDQVLSVAWSFGAQLVLSLLRCFSGLV